MTDTLFRAVPFSVRQLVDNIKRGDVALPDIQRPFVWQNRKVRDLFDSMVKGFPVGYLLFWATGADNGVRQIGTDAKGLPSLHTGYWDPFLAACQETSTVVNLHAGSSSQTLAPSSDSPYEVIASLFQVNSLASTSDWLFSLVPLRFPDIKLAMSEGGIGWVPSLLDRLHHMHGRYPANNDGGLATIWYGDSSPAEVLLRNFWFCSIYDPSTFRIVDQLNVDQIMMEVDYPHIDSTWPHTQATLADQLGHLGTDIARKVTVENAARLYRLEVNIDAE